MPQGRTAEIRGQGRQEAAPAGRPLTLAVAAFAAALGTETARAAEPWVGRWIVDPKHCKDVGDTTDTMPLILRPKSLEWFTARCTYNGATRRGGNWHLDARCSGEGERSRIPIVLQLKGERLVVRWGGARPDEMHRCQ